VRFRTFCFGRSAAAHHGAEAHRFLIVSRGILPLPYFDFPEEIMVLTTSELIGSLKHEVNILLHLAGKLEPAMLDYRPTPKQRTPLELLRYLSIMGPSLVEVALSPSGVFDPAAWTVKEKAAATRDLGQTLAAIAAHSDVYEKLLSGVADATFREEIAPFGTKTSRGAFIVNLALCGCAAYRTQLFIYLKACGRDELGTMNLWAGVDAPVAAV
jgi:hypothetical protein